MMKSSLFLLIFSLFLFLLKTDITLADSCPYCGEGYDPAAPGDESRVYALRREHESSSCPARPGQNGSSDGFGSSYIYTGPSPQELERRRKEREATRINGQGIRYANQGNHEKAIECYEKALKLNPYSDVIQKNLKLSKAKKANNLGLEHYNQGNWEMAIKYFSEANKHFPHEIYQDNLKNTQKRLNDQLEQQRRERETKAAKTKINKMIDNLVDNFSTQTSPMDSKNSASSLNFIGDGAHIFDGTKAPAPAVDLTFIDSSKPKVIDPQKTQKSPTKQKGLHFKEVPSSKPVIPEHDPYSAYTTGEIVLKAISIGNKSWEKSVDHLEQYLNAKNPHNVKVKEALSTIEGHQAGAAFVEKKKKGIFDPEQNDSYYLIEAISGNKTYRWPGQKNPNPQQRIPNPLDWKVRRTSLFLEALEKGNGNWEKSKTYLEEKIKANSFDYTAKEAKAYLDGFLAQYQQQKIQNQGETVHEGS